MPPRGKFAAFNTLLTAVEVISSYTRTDKLTKTDCVIWLFSQLFQDSYLDSEMVSVLLSQLARTQIVIGIDI